MSNELNRVNTNETIAIFGDPTVGDQYISFTPETPAEKVRMFNAINSPDARLADFINTPITIKDVIVSKVKLSPRLNKKDGFVDEEEAAPQKEEDGFRVIFLDKDGKSYTATSRGIYNSVCNLRSVFGGLHFEDGLQLTVKQVSTKNGNTLTITLV